MCGIAGSVNHSLDIQRLCHDLFHRGPDEQNTFVENSVQLHHQRLSIVDIACGRQPMHFEHLTIIFNGEIYNHIELRKRFNLRCNTNSDTETLLHLYLNFGASFLNYLDGMFAFVIYDKKNEELFIARDRAGKKPFYYYHDGKKMLFSSELNSLKNQISLQIDERLIYQFLNIGHFYKFSTPYKNVFELPAGSYLKVRLNPITISITKWWDINNYYLQRSADSFDTALEKTDEFLHMGIKRRVESSDLEVGSFLSGGIDSGIVTAIAKEYNPSLQTFTVSFDCEYDEAPLAKLVADKYETRHHEIRISFDSLSADIEKILCNYGEPFADSSAIPSFYVSQAAREHLTVILNGDGGDELFGGYRRYVPYARYDFMKAGPIIKNISSLLHSVLPSPNNKKSNYNFIYRLVDLSRHSGIKAYLTSTIDIFQGYEQYFCEKTADPKVTEGFDRINGSSLSGLQKIMNLDFDFLLAGDLLVKMDIATMAHSLEGRSPLLSKELLEYIPTLADDYKIKGRTTKYLLRSIASRYLPVELINQPKRGFEIPLKKWIDGTLRKTISNYILAPDAYCHSFIDADFIKKLWHGKIFVGDEKRAKMIWVLYVLEVWYHKVYLCKN